MGAIQMMNEKDSKLYESFNLEGINQSVYDKYYQEAVFIHGKETIKPIEKCIAEVHNELMTQLGIETDEKGKQKQANKANFNWDKFYKSYNFKNLEDEIQKIFGFRSVEIIPLKEEYLNKDKEFYYNCINAYTTMINRYPIDGLVTEKGFYDSTHSISLMITFTNTAIRDLTPGEFVGVLLHEIGHNCDPALVDIKYTQVNILSKYLTDRKDKITNAERKIAKKSIGAEILAGGIIIIFYILAAIMSIGGFKQLWRNIVNGIKNLFHIKISDSELNSRLERVKKQVEQDKKQFNRQEYSEAFADNFARMYGYGSELASALKKIDIETQKQYKSWYDLERNRQEAIIQLIKYTLQDEHKTEIHRIHALIREYKKDIEDKTLPKDVKKKMEDDLAELEAVYNSYTDDFDNFYKRCIEMMKEQLIKTDEAEAKKDKSIKENVDIYEETTHTSEEIKDIEKIKNEISKSLDNELKSIYKQNYEKFESFSGVTSEDTWKFILLAICTGFLIYTLMTISTLSMYIVSFINGMTIPFAINSAEFKKKRFQILGVLHYYDDIDNEAYNEDDDPIWNIDSNKMCTELNKKFKDILTDKYQIYFYKDKENTSSFEEFDNKYITRYHLSCIIYIDKKDNETLSKDFDKVKKIINNNDKVQKKLKEVNEQQKEKIYKNNKALNKK